MTAEAASQALEATTDKRSGRRTAVLELVLLAILVAGALAIRLYKLGEFPDTILADEADNAESSVSILYGRPPENGFFGLDWTAQPAMSAYKEAGFISVLGFTVFAMRLPAALFGALALIPFYFLLRRQTSGLAAMLATLLLATNVWFLNFSRSGWNCSDVCLYTLLAMGFLLPGMDRLRTASEHPWRTYGLFAAAGFACALGLYAYPAGRASTIAIAAFFPLAWFSYRGQRQRLLLGFIVLFLVEAAVFAPQGIYALTHWEGFTGRTGVVTIFNSPEYQADPAGTMLQQLWLNLRGPWDGSVNNTPQYTPVGEPQLDRVTGALALLGMLASLLLRRFRGRPETWLWWLMLLAGWIMTQVLTTKTPNGARGIGLVPLYIYFAGLGVEVAWSAVRQLPAIASRPRLISSAAGALMAVAILAAGAFNVRHYVDWQSSPKARQARHLYVTTREFPEWSATIVGRLQRNESWLNVGQWRDAHPITDISNPYGTAP